MHFVALVSFNTPKNRGFQGFPDIFNGQETIATKKVKSHVIFSYILLLI